MADDPQTSLRHFALMMRAPQHGWVIIPFVQALLDRSIWPEGQLYGAKDCFATKDYASALAADISIHSALAEDRGLAPCGARTTSLTRLASRT